MIALESEIPQALATQLRQSVRENDAAAESASVVVGLAGSAARSAGLRRTVKSARRRSSIGSSREARAIQSERHPSRADQTRALRAAPRIDGMLHEAAERCCRVAGTSGGGAIEGARPAWTSRLHRNPQGWPVQRHHQRPQPGRPRLDLPDHLGREGRSPSAGSRRAPIVRSRVSCRCGRTRSQLRSHDLIKRPEGIVCWSPDRQAA